MLKQLNDLVWGPWMIFFILGTGLFLTIRLKFLPIRNIGRSLSLFIKSFKQNERSFETLMTSLGAMMGTGNILGVTTAIILGGPGAIFWMNAAAIIGLTISYAENMLAVKYQLTSESGDCLGGPMYVLLFSKIPFKRAFAFLFALFTLCASIGMGNMTQSNCVSIELNEVMGVPTIITGGLLGVLTLWILVKKNRTIETVCSYLVPIMTIIYGISIITIIIICRTNLPSVIDTIVKMAFSKKAVLGGASGTSVITMFMALRWGMARGIFSNEAGMGSSAIALASAPSNEPVKQGYFATTNVFIDTIVMCTLTGIAILASGTYGVNDMTAMSLIRQTFSLVLGEIGGYIITISIVLFGFATIIGWAFYGKMSLKFMFPNSQLFINIYPFIYSIMVVMGAISSENSIWNFSDICNGLMIIPNMICLIAMSKEITKDTLEYEKKKSPEKRRTSYRAHRFLK